MARRRGFFAELQHQAAVAERNRQRTASANFRLQQQRQKEAERRAAAWRRAQQQQARADARDQAAAEKEAQRLYVESRDAEAEAMTGEVMTYLNEIDDILRATLEVDDFVDLEALRVRPDHPAFSSPHATPLPRPTPAARAPMPTYFHPAGTGKRTGKRAEQSYEADRHYLHALYAWWDALPAAESAERDASEQHATAERRRLEALSSDRAGYDRACAQRDSEAKERNQQLDRLIRDFAAGEEEALTEYFGIVLGNSAYPDRILVEHEIHVDAAARELSVNVRIPAPGDLPAERGFKYVKARDEIVPVAQTMAERKQRYATMLHNIAMRTIHELWEADRTHKLDTISLIAEVGHVDPATGRDTATPLLAVAVARDEFDQLVLDRIESVAALEHLGAVVSRSPFALTPISTGAGVRGR